MLRKALHILLALPLLLAAASCTDDLLYDDSVIGEGEAFISASVDFHPLVATNNSSESRSGGHALGHIETLSVFVYDSEGKLYKIINSEDLEDFDVKQRGEQGSNTDMPNDAGGKPVQAEESTARATFTLRHIPFGKYYFYVAANIPGLEDNEANRERFARASALRDLMVKWNTENVSANNQMFGYFTYNGNDDKTSAGFEAPLLVVNQKSVQFHSWIKRAASKVTLVYDGANLKEGVWIYIKNVTIHDIPLYCKIGNPNSVHTTDADSMVVNGETLRYNTAGVIPDGEAQGDMSTDWLMVSNGTGKRGAVTYDSNGKLIAEHSETDDALYFYENLQGNFKDAVDKDKYDKKDYWPNVGFNSTKPGDYDYKDNVPYGTYIEVEAYYISDNPEQVSQGNIKYRYMLGQDDDYDYNAIRNHHYKLTLGFNGWANQPTWHIEYFEPEQEVLIDPTYYVSYLYNQKSIFPIRFTGDVEEFEVEIVENNWAPYDPTSSDSVPAQEVADDSGAGLGEKLDFKWNRPAYLGTVGPANQSGDAYNDGNFNYGLQSPRTVDGENPTSYTDPLAPKKVTPIWAGFLALMVPGQTPEDLPANIFTHGDYVTYSSAADRKLLKDYFYGKSNGQGSTVGNKIPQNFRKFSKADLTLADWKAQTVARKTVGTGNNACDIVKNADGSTTINLPMWTRPKILLGISGFSGNNPYDTYQRKAMVRLKTTFKGGKVVERFVPVKQVRRVVNPKGVWRSSGDDEKFHVKLARRPNPSSPTFETFPSEGAWRAYVETTNGTDFIYLTGGVGKDETGAIVGNTDSPIDFYINFNGSGQEGTALCAIVKIEYHGYTCSHSIFVRQGYREPLQVVPGGARWSSFSLYRTGTTFKTDDPTKVDGNVPYKTSFKATGSGGKPQASDYITAELTANPMTLGTLFKRANYNGILIKNNQTLGALVYPNGTPFKMSNGGDDLTWAQIAGEPYVNYYAKPANAVSGAVANKDFAWSRFKAYVLGEERYYRVPTYDDYKKLLEGEYGLGVLYADGANETEMNVAACFGFEDTDNDGSDDAPIGGSTRGMRGIFVYNPKNANQIFFPLGARGIGRRTITGFTFGSYDNDLGQLRYGAVDGTLEGATNALRPIPYNLQASPGAIYWLDAAQTVTNTNGSLSYYLGWDMNYFDFNFNEYDFAISFAPGGDALPIKPVIDETGPW